MHMPRTDRKRVRKTYKKRAKPKEKGEKKVSPKRERDRANEDIPVVSSE